MTPQIFFNCFIAGFFGVVFHLLIKYRALTKRAKAANMRFTFKEYFIEDWVSIILSFLSVAIVLWVLDEILNFNAAILNYVKIFFVVIGYAGSSIVQSFLSKSEKMIMKTIDKKTDIADGKED